jgi:hypothetical protein
MLNFPNQLSVRLVDARSREAVPNLALKLTLFAPRKNNYTIPAVTDETGEARFSREHVRQSIQDDWDLFPMDYVSALEDCSPEVEVKVCSAEDVGRTIEAMKMFQSAPTISHELIEAFQRSVNHQYVSRVLRFNIEEINRTEIEVLPGNGSGKAEGEVSHPQRLIFLA